uniref:AT-hook containing transcription factor 1 n=1 Tax=Ursus maritimus TaxID=29073 RepID=A0A452UEU1_URSMA
MRGLTAKVTSGLLPLPEVSLQALEDEVTVESVLHGKIAAGRRGLACLACGRHLEVVHSLTGERLSAYRFSGVNQQPPVILALKEFSWQKRVGLLIGLEEAEGSVLCLYDLGVSRVVKAVVLPGRVTAIEPIISHGGASASTQHLHPSLRWLFGVAAVVTDVGQILLIDLCLDDMSCSQNELEASDLEVVTGIPAEVPHIRETVMREGRHLCFQLVSPSGTPVSALRYISRTNQLAVGFSDGYLALWNMKSMKREYYTQLEGGRVPVYAVTFQEPENDPRNCCYLWAVQSTQDSEGDVLSLHLLQLAFGDRKCLASGQVLYEGLEYCEERYTLDLTGGMFPLRGQTSNTKLLGCQSIEKYRYHGDRDEGMNEALSPDTSVSVFTWQVNIYGQGKPSMYLGLFDINRWYHAQMPDSLRSGEYLHNCSYFALWSLDSVVNKTYPHYILDILVNERSLSRGIPPSYPPPEQFFNANIYNFDATCLLNSGIVHITCNGFQKETLRFLKKSGASLSEFIPDGYNRCLMAGLLSPRLTDTHPSSLSQEEQLEAILSAAIHTSCLGLLTGCIKKWTKEEQPNSAANLRFVLEWTWNKVVFTKEEFDRLCTPLFDGSCRFIDPQTTQALQQCHLLLSNLNSVLNCFTTEAQEITERGLLDLHKKCLVTRLICQYTQVVLWFCHSGLLPEDDPVQLSRLYYNYPVIQNYYTSRRQKCERLARGKWNPDCLMIDEMVSQLGDGVERLWKRDEGGTGKYPPSSLHALLDIYLLDDVTETSKHAVTIYLLLDIMYSFPNKADTCIESFPTAFAIPWGQVKLIQGFWLIDHNDYGSGLDLLFHPATVKPVSWQHSKIIQAFMSQGEHRQALRYIQTMKPTVSSGDDVTLHLTVLLSNKYMVEAWTFLRQHSTSVNVEQLLTHTYKVCQETGLMEDLLKLPFTDLEQDCLVRFLQSSTNVRNHEFLLVHYLQRANYVSALRLNQTLKTNFSVEKLNCILCFTVSRPQPLSTVTKQAATGTVLTRSAFISNVLSKIGEIWACTESKGGPTAHKSPKRASSPLPHPQVPEAFVGTPILKASQKNSIHALLQRAKTLAMSVTSSGFAEFTPQSILRSGLRTPPLPSPSLSPGRSVTPPLRLKETRISFMEEGMGTKRTPGVSLIIYLEQIKNILAFTSKKSNQFFLREGESMRQSRESSGASTRSDQTTLEYQDAPSPGDLEGIFVASRPEGSSTELIINLTEPTEEDSDKDVLELEATPPHLEKQTGKNSLPNGHKVFQDSGHGARRLSFNELYPSGTLKLQYNFDTIEQQFCDLPDNKDSAECDIAEVDGELFGAQSNFTLILEGEEGDLETGDSAASNVLAPAANTAAAEETHECRGEDGGRGRGAELPAVLTSDQESQRVETLPHVPEPIKVAIAENLLDVIKDSRSKEITSDTVEQQSIHENIPLISQQVVTKVVRSTLKTVQETSTVTINVSQLDDTISSRTRRRGRVQNPSVRSQQEESAAVATPDRLGLSDRRTRKRKEISGSSEGACSDVKVISQNQQIPQNSVTPRRGRKRTEDNQDTLEMDHPMEQDLEVTPDSKLRRLKPSQLLEPATEKTKLSSVTKKTPKGIKKSVEYPESVEMVDLDLKVSKVAVRPSGSTRKLRSATLEASKKTGHKADGETKLSSVTKKTPRGLKKSIDYPESVEMVDLDLKVSKVARPRSTRKLRSANLEAAESRGHKSDGTPMDQPLPVEPDRSPNKRECSTLDVTEDSKLDSSQLSLQAEFGRPRKRGRPRKVNPSEDGGSKTVKEAESPKRRSGALRSQRRSTRKTPAKRKTDAAKTALEKSVLVPNEELAVVTGSKKKLTKRTEDPSQTRAVRPVSETHTNEEMTAMDTDNLEETVLAPAAPPKSSRSTRTRSSKAISFPDLSEPKNEFVFSTPVSKVPRKEKGTLFIFKAQFSSRSVFSLKFCGLKHSSIQDCN